MIKKVIFLYIISIFSLNAFGQFNTIMSKKIEENPVIVQPLYGPCLYEIPNNNVSDSVAVAAPIVTPVSTPMPVDEPIDEDFVDETNEAESTPIIIGKTASYNEDEMFAFRQLVALPLDNCVVTSEYGDRKHPLYNRLMMHNGIDLRADSCYVYSVMPGKVLKVSSNNRAGNFVIVEHGSYQSFYCHLEKCYVDKGDYVDAGQILGLSGNTGMSTGPHLHFALKHQGKYINPEPFLNFVSALIGFVDFKLSQMPAD